MVATTRPAHHVQRRTRPWFLLIVLLPIIGVLAWAAIAHWPERRGLELWTLVDDAEGLKRGTPITLAGIAVGEIAQLQLTDDDRVRVDLHIDAAHAHRMRAPVDAAACRADDACGTRVSVSRAAPTGFMVHPARSRGRALQSGDFVPSVEELGATCARRRDVSRRARGSVERRRLR